MQFPLGFRFFLRGRRHAARGGAPAHAASYITLTSRRVTTAKISALSTPVTAKAAGHDADNYAAAASNEDLVGGHATLRCAHFYF